MLPNGKIPKNKVKPVRRPDEQEAQGKEGTREEVTVFEGQSSFAMTEEPQHNKRVRRVSPIRAVANAKSSIDKWQRFAKRRADTTASRNYQKARIDYPGLRRSEKLKISFNQMNAAQLSDLEDLVETSQKGKLGAKDLDVTNSPSRALLYYFAKLAASTKEEEVIDLEFVDMLITSGGSVLVADRHGQGIIHEAARQWDTSVAKLLLKRGKIAGIQVQWMRAFYIVCLFFTSFCVIEY